MIIRFEADGSLRSLATAPITVFSAQDRGEARGGYTAYVGITVADAKLIEWEMSPGTSSRQLRFWAAAPATSGEYQVIRLRLETCLQFDAAVALAESVVQKV